ncbi:MAG: DUF1080 domain-containing protein, partial [Prevotellaceae bacterium]|nr:DUF1080 domain-containing protein [Prevotellaceae bacterium]
MKKTRIFSATLLLSMLAASCAEHKQALPALLTEHEDKASFTKINDGTAQLLPLFNGKDLTGWYTYTQTYGKNNDVEKAFSVEGGVLHFAGENMGYLCTNGTYKNYYLRVVFRWGEKKYAPRENAPRDSGILYHFPDTAADNVWPLSVECQVQENDCGDYYLVGGTTLDSPNTRPEGQLGRVVRTANFEKPAPEWNTIEIICMDNTSEHYVNGHKVNEATNLSVSEGKILLQLEGAEIFYKSVELL